MEFGISKCATMAMKGGKMVDSEALELPDGLEVPSLKVDASYKYLGMLESGTIKQEDMKVKLKKEYFRRVRKVLSSELNAGNSFHTINVCAVSAFRYSSGVLDWTKVELRDIHARTRKLLRMYKTHHSTACLYLCQARLYLPREDGGRGLLNVEQCVQEDEMLIAEYLRNSKCCVGSWMRESSRLKD